MTSWKGFFQTSTVWLAGFALASYAVWGPLVPNDPSVEVMTIAAVVFAISAALAFAPGVARFLSERYSVPAQQLVVGIVILTLGIAGNRFWLWLWREAGFPSWMLHTELNAFWVWAFLVGLVLIVSSYRAIKDDVPRTAWPRLLITFAVAGGLGVFVAWERPNMRPFVEKIRPYLEASQSRPGCG